MLKMMLTEKVKTLSTQDEIANPLEDEGDLANNIEQSDKYKQIYAVIVSIDKAITPALPTAPALLLQPPMRRLLCVVTLYLPMPPVE